MTRSRRRKLERLAAKARVRLPVLDGSIESLYAVDRYPDPESLVRMSPEMRRVWDVIARIARGEL